MYANAITSNYSSQTDCHTQPLTGSQIVLLKGFLLRPDFSKFGKTLDLGFETALDALVEADDDRGEYIDWYCDGPSAEASTEFDRYFRSILGAQTTWVDRFSTFQMASKAPLESRYPKFMTPNGLVGALLACQHSRSLIELLPLADDPRVDKAFAAADKEHNDLDRAAAWFANIGDVAFYPFLPDEYRLSEPENTLRFLNQYSWSPWQGAYRALGFVPHID